MSHRGHLASARSGMNARCGLSAFDGLRRCSSSRWKRLVFPTARDRSLPSVLHRAPRAEQICFIPTQHTLTDTRFVHTPLLHKSSTRFTMWRNRLSRRPSRPHTFRSPRHTSHAHAHTHINTPVVLSHPNIKTMPRGTPSAHGCHAALARLSNA